MVSDGEGSQSRPPFDRNGPTVSFGVLSRGRTFFFALFGGATSSGVAGSRGSSLAAKDSAALQSLSCLLVETLAAPSPTRARVQLSSG